MFSEIIYDGLKSIEITTSKWRMVVAYECGPRIASLGKIHSEENLLYWNKNGMSVNDWKLYGGHRVWITRPFADESVDTYASDNDMCSVSKGGDSVTVTAPLHPFTQLTRGMKISIVDDNSFIVENFIKNEGNLIYSGGVWSPTCIVPENTRIVIPLGEDNVSWSAVRIVIPTRFAGNKVLINDKQVKCTEEEMIIVPDGVLTKRCVCAPKGTIYCEFNNQKIRFTKHSDYDKKGQYQMYGCNIAAFVATDNLMAEMETYGCEQPVIPDETITNKEIWTLEDMDQ